MKTKVIWIVSLLVLGFLVFAIPSPRNVSLTDPTEQASDLKPGDYGLVETQTDGERFGADRWFAEKKTIRIIGRVKILEVTDELVTVDASGYTLQLPRDAVKRSSYAD